MKQLGWVSLPCSSVGWLTSVELPQLLNRAEHSEWHQQGLIGRNWLGSWPLPFPPFISLTPGALSSFLLSQLTFPLGCLTGIPFNMTTPPWGNLIYSSKPVSISASLNFPAQAEALHCGPGQKPLIFFSFFFFSYIDPVADLWGSIIHTFHSAYHVCLSTQSWTTGVPTLSSSPALCPHILFFYSSARNISKGQIIFHLLIQFILAAWILEILCSGCRLRHFIIISLFKSSFLFDLSLMQCWGSNQGSWMC